MADAKCVWQCPEDWDQWSRWLAAGLQWRLPVLLVGILFAHGRRTVTTARVAIEIDGSQHLANADAYRRDRRKDQLLQENGCFVLRFLAEDVGKRLDIVLDTILRALSHRRRRVFVEEDSPGN